MSLQWRWVSGGAGAGIPDVILPEPQDWEVSPVFSDVGAAKITFARSKFDPDSADGKELALFMDGVELPDCRFIIEDIGGNEVDQAESGATFEYTGRTMLGVFESAVVYPKSWPTVDATHPAEHDFTTATAGTIMSTLIQRAQTRGALTGITYGSFSAATDSNGAAWTKSFTVKYAPGVNYLQVLQNLVDAGLCEMRMVGRDLRLYNPGTLGTDRTTGANPLILRRGRDISESPRKETRRNLTNVQLVAGSSGNYQEVTDATSIGIYGRKESYQSQQNVGDTGSLRAVAQIDIDLKKQPRIEKTHALPFQSSSTANLPLRDFALGDWVYSDTGSGLVKYRVRQAVITKDSDGSVSSTVVLNDLIAEREVELTRKVAGIIGGTTATGASNVEPAGPDTTIPAAPTGVVISSTSYTDSDGSPKAQITVSWAAVSQNTDTTAITDLGGYEVQWYYTGGSVQATARVDSTQTAAQFSPVRLNAAVSAKVRAYDTNNHYSAWSTVAAGTTAIDTTPPPAPSTPAVTTEFAGSLRITWDGKDNGGANMPADWQRTEVHVSTVNGFTPDSTTRRDAFNAPTGGVTTVVLPVGTTQYVKFIAYDRNNNQSAASSQASGTPRAAQDGELISLSVAKLLTGTLSADIVLGARIKTANSGARVELSSVGIEAYNASGTRTVYIEASTGKATFVGDVATAASGARVAMSTTAVYGDVLAGRSVALHSNYGTVDLPPRIGGVDASVDWGAGSDITWLTLYSGKRSDVTWSSPESKISLNARGGVLIEGASDGGVYQSAVGIKGSKISLFADVSGSQVGDYSYPPHLWYVYDVLQFQQTSSGNFGRLRSAAFLNSNNEFNQFERKRVTVSRSAQAQNDVSFSYGAAFTARPFITATADYSGAPVGNDAAIIHTASSSGATLRIIDVAATTRTGSTDASIIAIL